MMQEELVDTLFEFPNHISGLEFEGEVPKSGSMIITSQGDIGLAISNGKYCITKDYNSSDIKVTKDLKNCVLSTITYTNGIMTSENSCIKGGVCPNGTLIKVQVNDNKNYDFYVIKDTGTKLTLIMDRNLGGAVAWYSDGDDSTNNEENSLGPITVLNYLNSQTLGWNNIESIEEYTYDNNLNGTTNTYGYQKLEIENGVGKLTSQDGNTITKLEGTSRARLLTREEVTAIQEANLGKSPTYLLTSWCWYLTAGPYFSNTALGLTTSGSFHAQIYYESTAGVRPVIELSK